MKNWGVLDSERNAIVSTDNDSHYTYVLPSSFPHAGFGINYKTEDAELWMCQGCCEIS